MMLNFYSRNDVISPLDREHTITTIISDESKTYLKPTEKSKTQFEKKRSNKDIRQLK